MKNFSNKLLFFIFFASFGVIIFFSNFKNVEAATFISENIQADTTWTQEGSPYILENTIEISSGITLSIDSGVIVKFEPSTDASILVYGNLMVNGEVDNKVYFTSNYDDTIGGDTDGDYFCYEDFDIDGNLLGEVCDGSFLTPSKNDWQGVLFMDSHSNHIKNAVFKYANSFAYLNHSYLNMENVELVDSNFGILTDFSDVDADSFNCLNTSNSCFYVTDNSHVSWVNSSIENIGNDAIYVYDSSTLHLYDFLIKNVDRGSVIYVFRYSSLSAEKLTIKGINDSFGSDIYLFGSSNLKINDSRFYHTSNSSCITVFDSSDYKKDPSRLEIENTIFDGGDGSAVVAFGQSDLLVKIENSIIESFNDFAIANYSSDFIVNAEDNFWGNSTGPFNQDENPTGTAGAVSNNVSFVPFCTTEKCKPRNPVILVPGIMGTEIFKNYDDEKEIWPNVNKLIFSITDNFLNDLALNPDGTENSNTPMKLGDIIRGTHLNILGTKYDGDTFEGLISELKKNGYVENKNLFVFPYDWRKSNSVSAEKLKDKIENILLDIGADKVDIVAHSMGGIVAKKYIFDNGSDKVGQLIFIGTPQLGAPKAFKVIMEGDDMGVQKYSIPLLSPSKVKYISQNMPGVFELLPGKKYIDGQDGYQGNKYITDYITPSFSSSSSSVRPDLSFKQTEDFLKNQKINTKMLDFADNLHQNTDNLDLSNLKVSNFIGCGTTKTIGHITAKRKSTGMLFWKKLVNTYDIEYENGDDTVPLRSADDNFGKKYYVKGFTHSELPSAFGLKELVVATLRGKKLTDFPNVSLNKHDCFIKGKSLTFYSMLPMMEYLVYDGYGNYTGPIKSIDLKKVQDPVEIENYNDEIEYGIPGVQYNKIGATTSIFLPAGRNYKIVIKSVSNSFGGNGGVINSYNLNIENLDYDDTVTNSVNFNNVPVDNSEESFQLDISEDTFSGGLNADEASILQVDENNDGNFENEVSSVVLNEAQANDVSAPITTNLVEGNNVVLFASDDNSGVLSTQYSLDGGNTWAVYTGPFTVELVSGGNDIVVEYFSTDNAGNVEQVQSVTIQAPVMQTNKILRNSGGPIIVTQNVLDIDNFKEVKSITTVKQPLIESQKAINNLISNIADISINKNTWNKEIKNKPERLETKSQTAIAVNTGFNVKFIWLAGIVLFFGMIFLVRNYKKR